MTRVYLAIIVGLLLVLGVVLWYQNASDYRPKPRPLAQLLALSDEQLSAQLIDDLAIRVFAPGVSRDQWQRFNRPARHVWALGVVETGCAEQGLDGFITYHAKDPGFPEVGDARDAIGLGDAADILATVASASDLGAIQARWRQALARPEALATRIHYMRDHLAALADPYAAEPAIR